MILDAGAIVKLAGDEGFDVQGGSISADGTAANPVVVTGYSDDSAGGDALTSARDDSAGGDSNGDGPSTGAPGDYSVGIRLLGPDSTLTATSLEIRFATTPLLRTVAQTSPLHSCCIRTCVTGPGDMSRHGL